MTEKSRPADTAILALVRGSVQGVGFRYETRSIARSLGIRGWVKNLQDGGVEVYAEGMPADIARLSSWLHKGPAGARVASVDVSERHARGVYFTFTIEE